MKKVLFLAFLIFGFVNFNYAQSTNNKPSVEQKQTINPIVDAGFTEWGKKWSYDKYVSRSAKINYIKVDEDYGDTEVSGDFEYRRLYQIFYGTFNAKINKSGQLVSMTYVDANGAKGSKTFIQN